MTDDVKTNQDTTPDQEAPFTKLDKSRVQFVGELSVEEFEKHRKNAVERVGSSVNIDGFRKGKIPEAVLIQRIGEMSILEEMAQLALMEEFPKLLQRHSVDAIGRPEIMITKIAAKSPLGYKITVTIFPDFELPDYTSIASEEMKKESTVEVADNEVEEAITQLRRMRAQAKIDQVRSDAAKASGEEFVPSTPEDVNDDDLPELTLEFVQTLGKFDSIEDFKTKLKENMKQEKLLHEKDKKRITIMENIMENTEIDIPEMFIGYEIDKMWAQMSYDVTMSGMTLEDYLKQINKTEEEIKKEWHDDARKRAKMQLIISKIAQTEKITPKKKDLDEQVKAVMDRYKEQADKERTTAYVSQMMTNQLVFEFLEAQK